jgi:hypothetical protein
MRDWSVTRPPKNTNRETQTYVHAPYHSVRSVGDTRLRLHRHGDQQLLLSTDINLILEVSVNPVIITRECRYIEVKIVYS